MYKQTPPDFNYEILKKKIDDKVQYLSRKDGGKNIDMFPYFWQNEVTTTKHSKKE